MAGLNSIIFQMQEMSCKELVKEVARMYPTVPGHVFISKDCLTSGDP